MKVITSITVRQRVDEGDELRVREQLQDEDLKRYMAEVVNNHMFKILRSDNCEVEIKFEVEESE